MHIKLGLTSPLWPLSIAGIIFCYKETVYIDQMDMPHLSPLSIRAAAFIYFFWVGEKKEKENLNTLPRICDSEGSCFYTLSSNKIAWCPILFPSYLYLLVLDWISIQYVVLLLIAREAYINECLSVEGARWKDLIMSNEAWIFFDRDSYQTQKIALMLSALHTNFLL